MKGKDPNNSQEEIRSVEVQISDSNGNGNGNDQNGHTIVPQENDANEEEVEITLTDHLNKRLLDSFLSRINQNPSLIPSQCSRTDSEEGDFSDSPSAEKAD